MRFPGILTPGLTYLVVAIQFSQGTAEEALSALKIMKETAAAALPTVRAAAAFDYGTMAMNVLERLLAMLLHMLTDTFPALYQRSAVPLWSVEAWTALWTAVVVFIAARLYRKMAGQTM